MSLLAPTVYLNAASYIRVGGKPVLLFSKLLEIVWKMVTVKLVITDGQIDGCNLLIPEGEIVGWASKVHKYTLTHTHKTKRSLKAITVESSNLKGV